MVYVVKMVNSFICMIINISDSVNLYKKQKNSYFKRVEKCSFIYTWENK